MSQAFTKKQHYLAWGLTWLSYAAYYMGRKGFSAAKKPIQDHLGLSTDILGLIDSLYLTAYSLGQFVNGTLGDRVGARRLVGYGMLLSAGACVAFGASTEALLFGVLYFVNGYAQSTGWPGNTRAMAEWTTPRNRGTVMAFWCTCYQVGGIAASFLAGALLVLGWRWAFFGPAVVIAVVGLLVLMFLRPGPGADVVAQKTEAIGATSDEVVPGSEPPSLATLRRRAQARVIRNPVVWLYGMSYFCIKFIRYALLFWLPYYLAKRLNYADDTAVFVSTAFEVGGIAGSIVIGTASDRLKSLSRSFLAATWLGGLCLALLVYTQVAPLGMTLHVISLGVVGALLFGPDSLMSGAASQDAGGPHAAAMATGFVNGMGSIGAILQSIMVPKISQDYGWGAVFFVFVAMAAIAGVVLIPTIKRGPPPRAS